MYDNLLRVFSHNIATNNKDAQCFDIYLHIIEWGARTRSKMAEILEISNQIEKSYIGFF